MPSPAAPRTAPARSEGLARLALVLGAVITTLLVLEIAVRVPVGYTFAWLNFVERARAGLADYDRGRYAYDDRLGYVPRPGYSAANVTIDTDGLRQNGPPSAASAEGAILAVGDSFTFGEEVGDAETWPAHLERLSGRRVLNAGVSGYGLDQIVLRAETLAAAKKPAVIVVSFIADDIHRLEMRRLWSADKPYFVLDGDRLALRNVPVPPRAEARSTLTFWQRTLGYSYLVEFTLRHLDLLHDWFGDHIRVAPEGTGETIACRLTQRLAELQRNDGTRIVVLAQYDPVVWQNPRFAQEQRRMTRAVLDCARANGLATLDSFNALSAHKAGPGGLYVLWHMNDAGNRLVAGLVAASLSNQGR